MRFSTSAVTVVLLAALTAPRCGAFLAPQPLTAAATTTTLLHRHRLFFPSGNVKRQLLQSTINGEAEAPAATDDDNYAVTRNEEEESAEPGFKLVLEDVPPASYEITSSPTAPGGGTVHTLTINLGAPGHPDPIIIETGKIGRQASAAVTLTRGDSVLYATASRDKDVRDVSFLPLSVEHQERFSSAGMTSGAFNKRDGRPAEHEILVCRLIDRPLRPLIAEGWRHETQLLSWILSYDGVRTCDPLAVTASAAALWLSDVPLSKPVAAAMVGHIDGQLVLNPTLEQMKHSRLNLTVAGTKDAVLMIEGAADFLPEDLMIEAVTFGHNAIKTQCLALEELGKVAGKEKKFDSIKPPVDGLQEMVDEKYISRLDDIFNSGLSKEDLSSATSQFSEAVVTELEEIFPEERPAIQSALKDLMCRRMFLKAKNDGTRIDGRKLDEVRCIDAEAGKIVISLLWFLFFTILMYCIHVFVGLFPRVHGSALFTRGQTQVVATATLGDSGMRQKVDRISGMEEKRFYLQYAFPPSCVVETGRVGAPGRREVGHGNLAERALIPSLPSEDDFPYTIRVESLVTESNGSSSMASVCGGCLALMDAGVPIKSPIAGIAMGMLLGDKGGVSDENAVIVSDILGTEDALGTMDFKVAGNREGITTFQLDIKCEGLTLETMKKALEQARAGRLHILGEMEKALKEPRAELPSTVPKVIRMKIPEDSIGKVIGPGGKQIRALIEDFELSNINVEENGEVQVSGFNMQKMHEAKEMIALLTSSMAGGGRGKAPKAEYAGPEPEVGTVYTGKITGIHNFGVFLEFLPGAEDGSSPGLEGLCHVSELHVERVRNCEGFVKSMNTETLDVVYLGKNDKGKYQLSRKAFLEQKGVKGRGDSGRQRAVPSPEMSEEEVDIISQAIENATAD
jgi:polyribonucleotide nucleotidyltransferase